MDEKEQKEHLKDFCNTAEALNQFLRKKGESHNCYKAYSRMERIDTILSNEALFLDTGETWNDVTDRELFNPVSSPYLNFGKCFSFSKSENVALWMLYGGIKKSGGMIDFTKKGMSNILGVQSIELGYFDKDSFNRITEINRSDFDIFITDILYYSEDKDGVYIKHSNDTCNSVPASIIECLSANKKVLAWSYENECRLIVRISKSLVPEKCNTVKISLANMDLGISLERVYGAPNYLGTLPTYARPSQLSSTIDWDLCKGKRCCKVTPDECVITD